MFHTFNLGKSTFFFLCISPPPPHALLLYLSLYPPHSLSLPSLVSELLSLSLSLPELTTQEVTTDSINSSYINPAIIAPPACLSAPHPPHPLSSFTTFTIIPSQSLSSPSFIFLCLLPVLVCGF